MGPQFHETARGVRFYQVHVPQLIEQLTRIADALEKNIELEKRKDEE